MAGVFDPTVFDSGVFDDVTSGGTDSFTLDAVLLRTQVASLTADAVLRRGQTSSLTANSVVRRNQSASLSANAVLKRFQAASLTADATIFVPGAKTFSLDAVLKASLSAALTLDAVLRRSQSTSLTADAIIRRGASGSFSADAILKAARSSSFTADAAIVSAGPVTVTTSFTADSVLRKGRSASFTVDAYKKKVVAKSLTADSVIALSGFTQHQRTGPHTGVDRDANHTLAHTFDRYVRGETLQDLLYDFDCRLTTLENSGRHTVCRRQRVTFDAIVRSIPSRSLLLDAYINTPVLSSLTLDAFIAYHFTLDAVLASAGGTTIYSDIFDRIVSGGIGRTSDYFAIFGDSFASVDGSEMIVNDGASGGAEWRWDGAPTPSSGIYQYDFWVPAADESFLPYYELDVAKITISSSNYASYLAVGANDDGVTWTMYAMKSNSGFISSVFTPDRSSWYTAKLQFDAPSTVSIKVWKRGTTEPSSWAQTGPLAPLAFAWTPFLVVQGTSVEGAMLTNILVTTL